VDNPFPQVPMVVWFALLLVFELAICYRAQRRLAGRLERGLPKPFAYLLIAPGTSLHELAHALMCVLVRVKVLKVVLFWPQELSPGRRVYGYIRHEPVTGRIVWIRKLLIGSAPLLLIPPVLWLVTVCLLWTFDLAQPLDQLLDIPKWRIGLLIAALALLGRSPFPSTGDYGWNKDEGWKPRAQWAGLFVPLIALTVILGGDEVVRNVVLVFAPVAVVNLFVLQAID
jgi:hypothetical protein